jgi:hypothetical protein
MSLAVYAPPRAILPIFNPVDFPDSFTSATSSTANYTTAITTLTTINTNLLAYQTKLNNVGQASNSFIVPSATSTYGPTAATYYTKQLSQSTSANQGWVVWTSYIIYYVIGGTTTTPSSSLVGWSYNTGTGQPISNTSQQTIKPAVNIPYYETFTAGLFQLNQAYNWFSSLAINTVSPVGTSQVVVGSVQSSGNGYFVIIK